MDKKLTKKRLYYLYWNKELSIPKIAKKLGCSGSTILYYMKKYNIPRRSVSEAVCGKNNRMFGKKISKQIKDKIRKSLKGHRSGKYHPSWKGGKIKHKGYILIWNFKHPFAKEKNYVYEHRLVMEAYLNKVSLKKWINYGLKGNYPKKARFLTKKEVVHHINGIKTDNRLKNLMLFKNNSEHTKYHKFMIVYLNNKKMTKSYNKFFRGELNL